MSAAWPMACNHTIKQAARFLASPIRRCRPLTPVYRIDHCVLEGAPREAASQGSARGAGRHRRQRAACSAQRARSQCTHYASDAVNKQKVCLVAPPASVWTVVWLGIVHALGMGGRGTLRYVRTAHAPRGVGDSILAVYILFVFAPAGVRCMPIKGQTPNETLWVGRRCPTGGLLVLYRLYTLLGLTNFFFDD